MIAVEAPETRSAERRHVLDWVLGERLGLEWRLTPGAPGRVVLRRDDRSLAMPDLLFGAAEADWLAPPSLPERPIGSVLVDDAWAGRLVDRRLPVLYVEPGTDAVGPAAVNATGSLGVDLLGGIFALLTRYEELVLTERDEHDRFRASASATGASDLLERPIADEYVELLAAAMRALWPDLPEPAPSRRLRLTHDVDWGRFGETVSAATALRATVADVVKRREPGLAWRRAWTYLGARAGRDLPGDPLDAFAELMDVAEAHGRAAAFYFVAARTGHPLDATYEIDAPWVGRTLRAIEARGHEIGLHASYTSHGDPAQLRREAAGLRAAVSAAGATADDVRGGRHHYLRWRNPDSWRAWADAGLAYDSTVGYAEAPGFRSGTAFEHPTFDVARGERLALRERPLMAMDVTFRSYQGTAAEDAGDRVVHLARRAGRVGGDVVLLWHNTSVVGRAQRRFYRDLVGALSSALA